MRLGQQWTSGSMHAHVHMYTQVCVHAHTHLVSEGGGFHQMKRLSVHLDDSIALATMSHSSGCFLRRDQYPNLTSTAKFRLPTHLSAKDLNTRFGS